MLGVSHKHMFVSEVNKHVRHLIYSVYGKDMKIYKDCSDRALEEVPSVQLYVFGFPCQPFSPAGKRKGLDDPRGQILLHCIDYVRKKKPALVIAENSARFGSAAFIDARTMMVNQLEEFGYEVHFTTLNTKEQGLPQSRPRFYLVAILNKDRKKPFGFPETIDPVELEKLLEPASSPSATSGITAKAQLRIDQRVESARKRLESKGVLPEKCIPILDVSASESWSSVMVDCSPCLTASRCMRGGGHYIMNFNRTMTEKEMCRLQGIPDGRFDHQEAKVPRPAFLHAVGNAMSSCVLARILANALPAAGLIDKVKKPNAESILNFLIKQE